LKKLVFKNVISHCFQITPPNPPKRSPHNKFFLQEIPLRKIRPAKIPPPENYFQRFRSSPEIPPENYSGKFLLENYPFLLLKNIFFFFLHSLRFFFFCSCVQDIKTVLFFNVLINYYWVNIYKNIIHNTTTNNLLLHQAA